MEKRTWHYVMKPAEYSISCDKCQGINIEWSEFEHMIWCYDCEIDTKGEGGIFDGPIPWGIAELMGISLTRYYMLENVVKYPRIVDHRIEYFTQKELTTMNKTEKSSHGNL